MNREVERSRASLARGAGQVETEVCGEPVTVFTFRPPSGAKAGILFLFDGLHREAAVLRDKAVGLAERMGLMTFAPQMDRARFPKWRYDRAGVIRNGAVQLRERWTGPWLQQLMRWARTATSQPEARLYLLGHSAGGQLLSRVCAYSPLSDTERIVITNPSVHVMPSLAERVPYGFGGLFERAEAIARLQVYLALPITIFLGQEDTGQRYLVKSKAGMRQGESRLERGRAVYSAAHEVARRNGWACNWRLVEVPGVGHSSRAMLASDQSVEALGGTARETDREGQPVLHADTRSVAGHGRTGSGAGA